MAEDHKSIDGIIKVGELSLPISGNLPCTILIGGTPENQPILEEAQNLEAEFEGERIILPEGRIYIATFPYPQLETITTKGKKVDYDLMLHLNGKAMAASHWRSDARWSQYGFPLPGYIEESDLVEIDPSMPVSGKGLEVIIKKNENAAAKHAVYVDSVYDIKGEIVDIRFPRWNDAELSSPLEISTTEGIYIVKDKVLHERDCNFLAKGVNSAIAYHTKLKNADAVARLKDVVQANIRRYSGRFRH